MAMEQVFAMIAATVTPNAAAVSPADVAVPPLVQNIVVPDYDFVTQRRFSTGKIKVAGGYTFNSQQTFDFRGHPSDSTGDSFD
jgi:hypothetical protein